jgi:O-antigen/teichoic acid export membrane protein
MLKDIKKVSKDSFIYGIGNVATKIIGFILIPIYTNPKYLSVADFGVLSILDISVQVLVAILGFSLYQGFIRWFWEMKNQEERKQLFFSSFLSVALLSAIFGSVLLFFVSGLSQLFFNTENYSYAFTLVIINAILTAIQTVPNSNIRYQHKSKLYTTINLTKFTLTLLFTLWFVIYLQRGITGIFEAQVIGNVFYFIISAPYIVKNISPVFHLHIIKELFKYSLPLVLASISGILLTTIDRFMLNSMGELEDVGIYSLGFKLGNAIKVFLVMSVQMALTPLMLKKINEEGNKRFYSKVLTYFSFVLMWLILGISMFSREAIELITKDPSYVKATYIVPIIATMVFFGMMKDTVMIGLHVYKKTKIIGIVITFAAILNLVLNIILIPYWGIFGAAGASLIAQLVFFITIYLFAQKSYRIPYEISKIIKIILVAFSLYALSNANFEWNLISTIIFKLFLVSLYPFLLYLLNFYEKVELETIKSFIKRDTKGNS